MQKCVKLTVKIFQLSHRSLTSPQLSSCIVWKNLSKHSYTSVFYHSRRDRLEHQEETDQRSLFSQCVHMCEVCTCMCVCVYLCKAALLPSSVCTTFKHGLLRLDHISDCSIRSVPTVHAALKANIAFFIWFLIWHGCYVLENDSFEPFLNTHAALCVHEIVHFVNEQ